MTERDRRTRGTKERERVREVREKQGSEMDTEEQERERQWSVRHSGTRKTVE